MSRKKEGYLRVRNSRKVYIPIYAMIIVLFILMGVIKFYGKEINNFAFKAVVIFAVSAIIISEIHRFRNAYEINPHSLVHTKGILVKLTRRMDLLAISDSDFKQNPWQTIFGYGDANIRSFSKESMISVKNINNPSRFIDILESNMNKKRTGGGKH